jgi:hypothetical protein
LFFCFCASKKDPDEWKGFLQDAGTIASYYLFSLCLSVLPSGVVSRILEDYSVQPLWALKLFERKETRVRVFGDVGWLLTKFG